MKTILAPVDFSEVTPAVIESAAELAQAMAGRVVILHVAPPPICLGDSSSLVVDLSEACDRRARAEASQLARFKSKLDQKGIRAESVEIGGLPVAGILEQARKFSADYIVMGSHGHGAVYDVLIGGTTHAIMKKAGCPVVVVPSPAGRLAGGTAAKALRRARGAARRG